MFPDWALGDVPGSPYAIGAYEAAPSLGGEPALAALRERLAGRGVGNHARLRRKSLCLRSRVARRLPRVFRAGLAARSGAGAGELVLPCRKRRRRSRDRARARSSFPRMVRHGPNGHPQSAAPGARSRISSPRSPNDATACAATWPCCCSRTSFAELGARTDATRRENSGARRSRRHERAAPKRCSSRKRIGDSSLASWSWISISRTTRECSTRSPRETSERSGEAPSSGATRARNALTSWRITTSRVRRRSSAAHGSQRRRSSRTRCRECDSSTKGRSKDAGGTPRCRSRESRTKTISTGAASSTNGSSPHCAIPRFTRAAGKRSSLTAQRRGTPPTRPSSAISGRWMGHAWIAVANLGGASARARIPLPEGAPRRAGAPRSALRSHLRALHPRN